MNANKFIDSFKKLDTKDKLLVAKAISKELKPTKKEDKTSSEIVREFFEQAIDESKKEEELSIIKDSLTIFNNLKDKNKKEAIKGMAKAIKKQKAIDDIEKKKEVCEQIGHAYTDWKHLSWTEEDTKSFKLILREKWVRECARCHKKEESFKRPNKFDENTHSTIKR